MENGLTVKQSNEVGQVMANDWGVPTMSASDIIIPKILPMQGLSVAVSEGRAAMGEFRSSLTNELIGKIDQPFEAIPFYLEKMWDIQEQQPDGSFKWARTIPVIDNPLAAGYNDNLKWEDEVDGKKVKNIRRLNFYMLLPQEIEKGGAIPYVFSFKSTSIKEGKKLLTQMYVRNIRANLPPAANVIILGGVRRKNDKGVFIVPNYSLGRRTTDAELAECLNWIKLIRSGKAKADDSDIPNENIVEMETVGADGAGEF